MLDHGHPDPYRYTLGTLSDEADIVGHRVNLGHVTTATLLQQAVAGVLSKQANRDFRKQMTKLSE